MSNPPRKDLRRRLLVPAFFLLVTLMMTYPLALHIGTGVRDLGDGLLTSWIMSWNAREIVRGDLAHYFDANIFYPNKRSLAYSEHLFTQSLASLPVRLFSSNPLLAHNLVLLLAYLTSALGMYALARHLTGSTFGGLVAGLVFGFSPFMSSHFVHIQIITAGGLPLAFLFLHRYFETARTREAVFFALAASFQALANGYYALYLALFAGCFIAAMAAARRRLLDLRFWRDMLAAAAVVLVLVGPFVCQYVKVAKDMNFSRSIGAPARLTSFLAASPTNRLYGALTERFQSPEKHLFPGALAFLLAIGGLASAALGRRSRERNDLKNAVVYGVIALFAALFTLGANGPYVLLYRFVPGFKGVRVPARFQVFVMFGLAVLAAFGARALLARLSAGKRRRERRWGLAQLASVVLPVLILAEYAAFPLPLQSFPPGRSFPEVYGWLAARHDGGAVLELPLPPPGAGIGLVECPRMYYSTRHWHNLVNGYSGFFPPLYDELLTRWRESPIEWNVRDARVLGVRYLVVHRAELVDESASLLATSLARLSSEIREAARFGADVVYEFDRSAGTASLEPSLDPAGGLRPVLPDAKWRARASVNDGLASRAMDRDPLTRWNSGPQTPGDFFEVDFGEIRDVAGLSLKLGPSLPDYPRGCRVDVSRDGLTWTEAVRLDTPLLPIRVYLKAADISYDIVFPKQPVRRLRVTLTAGDSRYFWSIYGLTALE